VFDDASGSIGETTHGENESMHLDPILYVPDQYAEREFYELFGFERVYEGDEFPGFWPSAVART
jgi:hypothetical protein